MADIAAGDNVDARTTKVVAHVLVDKGRTFRHPMAQMDKSG